MTKMTTPNLQPVQATNASLVKECKQRALCREDLDALMHIESMSYSHPWTRQNFLDSFSAHYWLQGLFDNALEAQTASLVGYFVAMKGVDEVHLLNLTVAPHCRRKGFAKELLDTLRSFAQASNLKWIWLEVRKSNTAAIALYTAYGFLICGERKNYYPLGLSGAKAREDAVLMSYHITPCN
jgi:ribosomal-protein-alanine N-acetyltransferase